MMKIDLTSKQNRVDIESTSATKLQQNNAQILFGKRTGAKILKALELYSKEKSLRTDAIDSVITALKTKNTEGLEKFAGTAPGKKMAKAALAIANAKSPVKLFAALKGLKFPKALEKVSGIMAPTTAPQRQARRTAARVAQKAPQRVSRRGNKTRPKVDRKAPSIDVAGMPLSRAYAMNMPPQVMDMLQRLITPAVAKRIVKNAEPGQDTSVRGLGYAKIKKLIDAIPEELKEENVLPNWVEGNQEGSVTVDPVADTGEIGGYYSPYDKKAMFRVPVIKEGSDEPAIVSIES